MAEATTYAASPDFYAQKTVDSHEVQPTVGHHGYAHDLQDGTIELKYRGTEADQRDMSTLGRVQELRRNFRFTSMIGFACTLIATWEVLLTTLVTSLTDGGTAGLVWGFVVVVFGLTFVYLSIAELASMAPTSGGQYHWVSELAPNSCQRFLSYMVGWMCFTGWQAAITSITFLAGTIIQGLIVLNSPSYVYERWHGTLLVAAITAFAIGLNTLLAKRLPIVENLLLVLHIVGFLAIMVVLWVMAPKAPSASDVFTSFTNAGGWNSQGSAFMVGLLSPVISMIGFDCAVHMSEEVRDASITLPKAMLWAFAFNATLGFVMVITLCFTLGDVNSVLASTTGYPFIQVFYNATNSLAGATVMVVIVVLTLIASAVAEVATASRQLWSFARDGGVPFSHWLSHVRPGWNIPLNAVLVSLVITTLLSLINIGSTAALNAILALTTVSLLTSYIVVISCVLLKRLRGQPLPPARWSLGKFGVAVNVIALCYLLAIYTFAFFPAAVPVTAESMNYAIVIFGAIILFAVGYWAMYGKAQYVSPASLVKRSAYYQ
jgi:amino acid permease (GABA permease)